MDPCLTSEIFALIIKERARATTNPAELLITTSLASKKFAYTRTEFFRSTKLGPSAVPVGVSGICRFLELISADAESEQNGLASYVQSLNICLAGLQTLCP